MIASVPLHVHSDLSILDGGSSIKRYAERAALLGLPALPVTDHGTLAGAYRLVRECAAVGIKPIIGMEAYVAPHSREIKEPVFFGNEFQRKIDVSGGGKYTHLTLIAKNATGVINLFKLSEDAFHTGFYGKPRIDLLSLAQYSAGLICLTGCLGSHINTYFRLGMDTEAYAVASELMGIFGRENLFVELMYHNTEDEKEALPKLIALADAFNLRTVVTPDSHYCEPEDAEPHDMLLCIQTKAKISDENRFRFMGSGYHLPSTTDMLALNRVGIPMSAVASTVLVAEMVEEYTGLFDSTWKFPKLPDIEDEATTLTERTRDGLRRKGILETHWSQAEHELSIVIGAGFPGYFLALERLMELGRDAGFRFGPARGSAAGSVIPYALNISGVDPTRYGLLFERFLNSERLSPPDIDIDIQHDKRDEFIQIARELFGERFVAQICTYGTIGARSAIKDVVRVMGDPPSKGLQIIQHLPPAKFGRQPALSDLPKSVITANMDVIGPALRIEGLTRHSAVHPSGVIVSPVPLSDVVPVKYPGGKGGLTTELTGEETDRLGLVKYDFLALTTLTIIEKCLQFVGGEIPDNFEDPNVFRLLSQGDTSGIFQLESPGMRKLLKSVRPRSLLDIASVLALYRPGPMGAGAHKEYADRKNGRSPIHYPSVEFESELSDALSETYGVIVFQEQVLNILKRLGGYTYASAELIFNAMRKKDTAKMEAARPEFEQRLSSNGYSAEAIRALWDVLVPFSDYSFNKSHSISYAMVSYWTAYLKYYHPWEYWAAFLTYQDADDLREYLKDVEMAGIPILPPDINDSQISWTPTKKGIRFGIGSIKGISGPSFTKIRGAGPYGTIREWWEKAPSVALNSSILSVLIKAGCFDSLEPNREGLLAEHDKLAEIAREWRKNGKRLYTSFELFDRPEPSYPQRNEWEKEVLGLAVTRETLRLQVTRWLNAHEWLYVVKTFEQYPGRTPVSLTLGPLTTLRKYVTVQPDPRLFASLSLVGIERE